MIKHLKDGIHLFSKDGSRHLGGPYKTEEQALKRERQVNFWKNKEHIKKRLAQRRKER
jgi:hypothetical protein